VSSVNLTHHFLIAMPSMADPYFSKTLTYICEHNDQGALGVVVNRPIDMTLGALFERLSLTLSSEDLSKLTVYFGGPVQTDRGFVLHSPGGRWESSLPFSERMHLTTSRDILDALARGDGPDQALVALGYAGWSAGQLEDEMSANAWLTVPADDRLVFGTPLADRWQAACRLLGVDLLHLSSDAGHA
jgi:putative transcriptional regulator